MWQQRKIKRRHFMPNLERYAAACSHRTKSKTPQTFHLNNPECGLYGIRIRMPRPQKSHPTNPRCSLYVIRIRTPKPQKFHLTNLLDSTQTRAEDMQLSMQTNSLPTVKRNIKYTVFKHFLHTRLVPLHKIA